jgi:Transposase
VSSLPPKVKAFARAVRCHWGIENRLHWTLDVTFAEDASRVRKDHGPFNLAMLRRLAVSILQRDRSVKDNLRGKRLRAGWDDRCYSSFSRVFPRIKMRLP